jgi:sec-independent protein translocase protein TatA
MNTMLAAFLGGWEIVLILVVFLVLFGAKKLPELARGLGKGIREFKKATQEVTDEVNNAMDEPPVSQQPRRIVSNPPTTAPPTTDQAVPQSPPSSSGPKA